MFSAKNILSLFIEALFPFSCHLCGRKTPLGKVACSSCLEKIAASFRPAELIQDIPPGTGIFTLSAYQSIIADAIRISKYRPSPKLLNSLVKASLEKLSKDASPEPDLVIPVPMHSSKLKNRGFNQAEIIARKFAETWNCNYSPCITKSRQNKPQAECNESERAANLKDAFKLAKNLKLEAFRGKTLFLIDDVATTGSTINECAKVLSLLDPKEIFGFVLTHTPKYSHKTCQSTKDNDEQNC